MRLCFEQLSNGLLLDTCSHKPPVQIYHMHAVKLEDYLYLGVNLGSNLEHAESVQGI